jgi:flagellar M-ring protein FliF
MRVDVARLVSTVRERWGALGARQKQLAFIVGIPLIVALAMGVFLFARTPYGVLFSGLAADDGGDIVAALDREKIPYRLSQGGTTILVPTDKVHAARLKLAAGGLPRGGTVGFELMDKTKFGATDFERQANYDRALSGELSRTISQVASVQTARVLLATSEPSAFIGRTRKRTASVLVILKPGKELDQAQVKGIMHLVASGVEGLAPADVTVVDGRGRLLSAGIGDWTGLAVSSAMDTRRVFQGELERSVTSLLEQVLGPGNVVVRVAADLSFDEKTVQSTLFQPVANKEGILRSVQEVEEYFKGQGSRAASGASTSVQGTTVYQSGQGGGTESSQERRESTRNYEINQVTEKLNVAPGVVRRLSISVAVNRTMSAAETTVLETMVSAAIGVDKSRSDVISVIGTPFDTTLSQSLTKQAVKAEATAKRTRTVNLVLGAVALAALALMVRKAGSSRRRLPPVSVTAGQAAQAADLLSSLEGASARGLAGVAGAPGGFSLMGPLTPEASSRRQMLDSIDKLSRAKPEVMAQLVRTWIVKD